MFAVIIWIYNESVYTGIYAIGKIFAEVKN